MQTINRRTPSLPEFATLATGGAVIAIAAALIALPPLYSAVLLVGTVVATLIMIHPRWGFYLLLLSIPAQDLGAVGELTATNVLFGLTLIAWLARRLAFGGEPLPRSAVGQVFALFVGGLALSLVAAQDRAPGIAVLFQWLKALGVYFLALDFLRTRRQAVGALAALLLAGAAEGAVGLVQYLTGIGPASFAVGEQFSRAFGTFGRPNSYAGYLEMILPLGLALCYLAVPRRAKSRAAVKVQAVNSLWWLLFALGGTGLVSGAIFASFSRGAWLGSTSAMAVAIILFGARARAAAALGAVLLALLLLAGGKNFLPAGFADRIGAAIASADTPDIRTAHVTAENFATLERKAHWEAGLAMFTDNRLLGVGIGNFNLRFSEYTVSPTFMISQGHAHNYYIHVAAEAGLVGLTTYLLLCFTIIVTGLRALYWTGRPGADPFARVVVIACLAVITAVGIHNLFENLHVLSMGVQLSTVWALLTIVTQPAWTGQPPAAPPAATIETPQASRERA